jgi:hypothetical protein
MMMNVIMKYMYAIHTNINFIFDSIVAATRDFLVKFPRHYILLKQYLNFPTANNVAR